MWRDVKLFGAFYHALHLRKAVFHQRFQLCKIILLCAVIQRKRLNIADGIGCFFLSRLVWIKEGWIDMECECFTAFGAPPGI